jgi:hypothetical protein
MIEYIKIQGVIYVNQETNQTQLRAQKVFPQKQQMKYTRSVHETLISSIFKSSHTMCIPAVWRPNGQTKPAGELRWRTCTRWSCSKPFRKGWGMWQGKAADRWCKRTRETFKIRVLLIKYIYLRGLTEFLSKTWPLQVVTGVSWPFLQA